ncbi:MAG TPA: hypothetical protein VLT62_01365 [Candidatus Methylomirabilis sp.]|nr:hypothetical protein [Candidatus Methylomirabilis sp.]
MKRPPGVSAELRRKIERAVIELLLQEEVPIEERFDGVIMLMRAHGLPCDHERVEKIRKYWLECVAEQRRRRKKT